MRIYFPNSAHLQNIEGFIRKIDATDVKTLLIESHDRYIHVHPLVLAMTACAAQLVKENNGDITSKIALVKSMPYLIRMGLFNFVHQELGQRIIEHEESGRFIPLIQIRTSDDLGNAIANMIPLLHAPTHVVQPIQYVFSEMVRNVLEHSYSSVGAFVCAQYYRNQERLSIGIADAGIGIHNSIIHSHRALTSKDAIALALQPGISGATPRIGGNETNAGAGLFFTKSIAALSRNYFVIYSGDCLYKLMQVSKDQPTELHTNPYDDKHNFKTGLPKWPGTVIGINISVKSGAQFTDLLSSITKAYTIDVRHKNKEYFKKVKFI